MGTLLKIKSRLVVAGVLSVLVPAAVVGAGSGPALAATSSASASSPSPSQACAAFQALASAAFEAESGWNAQAPTYNPSAPTFAVGQFPGNPQQQQFPDFAWEIAAIADSASVAGNNPLDCSVSENAPPPSPPVSGAALCPAFQGLISGLEAVEQGWDSGSGRTDFAPGSSNDIGYQVAQGAQAQLGCDPALNTTPASSPVPVPSPGGGSGPSPSQLCPVFQGIVSGLEAVEQGWDSGSGRTDFAPGSSNDIGYQVAQGADSDFGCSPPISTAPASSPVPIPSSGGGGPSQLCPVFQQLASGFEDVESGWNSNVPAGSGAPTFAQGSQSGSFPDFAGQVASNANSNLGCSPPIAVSYPGPSNTPQTPPSSNPPGQGPPTRAGGASQGYWETAADGGIFTFGGAQYYGSMGGQKLAQPVVGMSSTADGAGYWEVAKDGGIFSFGDAAFHGSMGGTKLVQPVVGMAVDPATGGYWEVAKDGGIFAFDAPFLGSMGGKSLVAPVVGMAATPDGGGYWLVAQDGGIFAFGDAPYDGSMGGKPLVAPVVGMASAGQVAGAG